MTDSDGGSIQSVERAFDLIEALRVHDDTGVTELAETTDLPLSTVHNHLQTLVDQGYVVRNERRYRLADRFVNLGTFVKHRHELVRVGEDSVEWLAERTGETANLAVEEQGRAITLVSERGEGGMKNFSHLRNREYLHSTAAGKAILTELPELRVEHVLEEHGLPAMTPNTIVDERELEAELATVQDRGYAINDRENTEGIRAVAVSIKRPDDTYAALSVSGAVNRLTDRRIKEELPEVVRRTAKSIEIDHLSKTNPEMWK